MRMRIFTPADLVFALLLLLILVSLATLSRREEGSGFPDPRIFAREKGQVSSILRPRNVNRTDAATLAALPGVGSALAQRIVRFREEHGPFRHLAELQQVPGVGPKRFARIAPLLTVTEEESWSTK